jgi:hypothetical protein
MIFRDYLSKFLTAIFGGLFITLGILTFGNSNIFDWFFLSVLIFTAIICHKNINIVSIVLILFAQLALNQVVWFVLNEHYLVVIFFYVFALWAIYQFRYDWAAKLMLFSVIIVIISDIYWFINDYPRPQISWYIWLMTSNLFVRYLIFSRVGIVDRYFPRKGLSTHLDWIIYKLSALIIIIQAILLMEYLVRHVLGLSNALFIYYCYPYLFQGIATISIWVVFNESYKQLMPHFLKA